jgi:hypothetical protein
MEDDVSNLRGPSRATYDLMLRAPAGAHRQYACRELLHILDDAGRPAQQQRRTALLREEILPSSSEASPQVRWTYSDFSCEIECNYIDDAYGLRVPVRQFWETTPAEVLPAAGRIVVESPIEKTDIFYPDTDQFGLSKTSPSAFMTAELCLHTRQFSLLATRTHGGIDRLKRVEDSVQMTFSGRADRARNGDMFEATVLRGLNTLRFEAVTTRHGREVALLTYDAPYDVSCPGWGPTHCEQVGRLWVDLETGWPVAGNHYQTNYMGGVPLLPEGKQLPVNVRFETSIELISD